MTKTALQTVAELAMESSATITTLRSRLDQLEEQIPDELRASLREIRHALESETRKIHGMNDQIRLLLDQPEAESVYY